MQAIIRDNIEKIQELCRKHDVKTLYVFGSAARDVDFTKDSDVDFLYTFDNRELIGFADNFFSLKWALEETLHRRVDLVSEKMLRNKYLIQSINEDKVKVYEA